MPLSKHLQPFPHVLLAHLHKRRQDCRESIQRHAELAPSQLFLTVDNICRSMNSIISDTQKNREWPGQESVPRQSTT